MFSIWLPPQTPETLEWFINQLMRQRVAIKNIKALRLTRRDWLLGVSIIKDNAIVPSLDHYTERRVMMLIVFPIQSDWLMPEG